MGIVAYYIDVDAAQLAALKAQPALIHTIGSDPRFRGAHMIDIDKDWQVVAWLASPNKRLELCHETAQYQALAQDIDRKRSPEAFERLVAKSAHALGCAPATGKADPILSAIEGRGTKQQREPKLDFGLGAARVFPPEEVKLLAVSFARFDPATLRRNFNRKTMARFDVGGMDWATESDEVLDEFLVPSFKAVSAFYLKAARQGHYVLVYYQ